MTSLPWDSLTEADPSIRFPPNRCDDRINARMQDAAETLVGDGMIETTSAS